MLNAKQRKPTLLDTLETRTSWFYGSGKSEPIRKSGNQNTYEKAHSPASTFSSTIRSTQPVATLPPLSTQKYDQTDFLKKISTRFSSEDKELFLSLINYCYDLQNQVTSLKTNKEYSSSTKRAIRVGSPAHKGRSEDSLDLTLPQETVSQVVEKIESKLTHIRQLFSNTDTRGLRQRTAVKIQACMRRKLALMRYSRYMGTFQRLQTTKCASIINICMGMIWRIRGTQNKVTAFIMQRHHSILQNMYRVWKITTSLSAPRRREALKKVEIKAKEKARQLVTAVRMTSTAYYHKY